MEARLFFLSIWCGIYGQIVRVVKRSEPWASSRWTTMAINGLFWATFTVMGGMLMASYTEKMDLSLQYAILFGVSGFVIGAVLGYWKGGTAESREPLVQDNLEWADTGFSAILLASIVMFFFVQAFKIPSGSMRMTFVEGDHLFVNKFIYGFPIPLTDKKVLPMRKVQVNDIVIFRFPARDKTSQHYGKDFIKRCVALEGQEVKIVDKQLYVDGVKRVEDFKRHVDGFVIPGLPVDQKTYQHSWETGEFGLSDNSELRDNFGPVIVPPGHIFVMGDNRDRSFDSRFWGPLKVSAIKGRAWFLYFPFSRARFVK